MTTEKRKRKDTCVYPMVTYLTTYLIKLRVMYRIYILMLK